MKTLIVYASSHGTTEKVARYIASKLQMGATDVIHIKDIKNDALSTYDRIIIGASIHAGQVQRSIKNFCQKNETILLSKPLALYLSGMNKPEYEKQFEKAFPEVLRKHAMAKQSTGGEFLLDKMNFFEKAIIKKIAGVKESVSEINYEAIDEFIQAFES